MTIRIHKDTIKQELLNPPVLISGLVTALLYIIVSTLILNSSLIRETLTGPYSLQSKLGIVIGLTRGVPLLYNPIELSIVFLLGFLMGINLMLIIRSLRDASKREKTQKKTAKGTLSLGLGMLGFIATSGCASCGLTLISLLGPTVSISLLPYQTFLLQLVSFVLLMISLVYTMNRRNNACVVVRY